MPVVEWDEQAAVTEWENQPQGCPAVTVGAMTYVMEQAGKVEAAVQAEAAAAKREELRGRGGCPPEELFDKHYWNGGAKVGGYAHGRFGETYMDFACHWHTVNHILARRPESVLELGAARGYIGKKLLDAGVRWAGLEISRHCHMTRCCDPITVQDLCKTPWVLAWDSGVGGKAGQYDLCFSVAVLEHVPEEFVPAVIREMARLCRRGLHGVDFGGHDDGFDKTHCTLQSREWWMEQFARHAPGWPVEVLDKEELERGVLPQEVLFGDGKVKLEVGSFTSMTPFGWVNIDIHDLDAFAQPNNYRYLRHDVRQGLPFQTGTVDLIHCVRPGGLVRTLNGMRPIENVRVGDEVLTHRGRWRKVTRTYRREVDDEKVTELRGACVPFTLTGNHEVYTRRASRSRNGLQHGVRRWIPSSLLEVNDLALIPLPPLEAAVEEVDLAYYVNQVGSEVIHGVISSRAAGKTYAEISEQHGVTWGRLRGWLEGKVPRGVTMVKDDTIKYGNSGAVLPRRVKVDEQFGRFLGYMLSDGYASVPAGNKGSGGQFGFVFAKSQLGYAKDSVNLVRELFGLNNGEILRFGSTWRIKFCCRLLSGILKRLMGSRKGRPGRKRIPRALLRCGNEAFYRGLVVGLWRGDGSTSKNGVGGYYASVDRRLAYQVQEILARLGIASRVRHDGPSVVKLAGRVVESVGVYRVQVSGESARRLYTILNIQVPECRRVRSRSFTSADGIETPVRTREYRYSGPVYNLEVEEDNSYTVNGVAVHNCNHFFEHLSYKDGLNHLRECRRVLKPQTGALRIAVPDAQLLACAYAKEDGYGGLRCLSDFAEISDGVEAAPTAAAKLWELLFSGHQAAYDAETLLHALKETGFEGRVSFLHQVAADFAGHPGLRQIIRETNDTHPCLSLYVDAIPAVG